MNKDILLLKLKKSQNYNSMNTNDMGSFLVCQQAETT
jgi:hypothetical protein